MRATSESEDRGDQDHARPFTTLDQTLRSDRVRQQLEAAIVDGVYKAGDRLPTERELTEAFGVSRVSIREALRSLEALGMLRVVAGKGRYVAEMSDGGYPEIFRRWLARHQEEVLELLLVRASLDGLAASEAARSATPETLKQIRMAFTDFDRAARRSPIDLDDLVETDIRFHEVIASASGKRILTELISDINRHFADARRATLAPPYRPLKSTEEHRAILEAIAAQDPVKAQAAMINHVEAVREALVAFAESAE